MLNQHLQQFLFGEKGMGITGGQGDLANLCDERRRGDWSQGESANHIGTGVAAIRGVGQTDWPQACSTMNQEPQQSLFGEKPLIASSPFVSSFCSFAYWDLI